MAVFAAVAKRAGQAVAVLVAVSLLVYLLLDLLPGDAAEQIVGPAYDLTPEERAERVQQERVRLGLDRPLLVRYLAWIGGLVTGDLGRSVRGIPISGMVQERLSVSLEIALASVIIALVVSVLIAVVLQATRAEWAARVASAVSSVFVIVPQFYLAFLLVLVFAVALRALPATGYVGWDDPAEHVRRLVLPVATLVLPQVATYLPYLISGLRTAATAPMAIAAAARGISQRRMLFAHLLPNGILPTISMAGLVLASLLGNMVIVEFAFSIPGLGSLLLRGIGDQDLQLVATLVVVVAAVYVIASIVVDVVYALVDPRLRRVHR